MRFLFANWTNWIINFDCFTTNCGVVKINKKPNGTQNSLLIDIYGEILCFFYYLPEVKAYRHWLNMLEYN